MAGHEIARVLDADAALDARLEEVSDDAKEADGEAREQRERKRDVHDVEHAHQDPDDDRREEAAVETLPALVGRDARRQLMHADLRANKVREGVVSPDREHDTQGEKCPGDALVVRADQHDGRKGERRVERPQRGHGHVGDVGARREDVPAGDAEQQQKRHDDKRDQAAGIGRQREEQSRRQANGLVGHTAAHARDAVELRAAQPRHAHHEQGRREGPAEKADEDDQGIDGARGRPGKELLSLRTGLLASQRAGGATVLAGVSQPLEAIDLLVEADALATGGRALLGPLGRGLVFAVLSGAHEATTPPKRRLRFWKDLTARKNSQREKSGQ